MARFLHTRIRVSNLDQSIDWYCNHLGFKLQSRTDKSPSGNHVAHLELPGNEHTLELTYSADYQLTVPEDLMHIALSVPDLIAFCDELEKNELEIWPEDWRESFPNGRKMAFIDDPDGYEIELLED
ncbi:MAG: VOC family protein [Gemmatimonadetes bacterium]|jgi:lactoylglutathione lyase|nr:VOC family protein [Gemmatimonadota bacterium]MBT5329222.1 VOC family protein [Gemmatimonadota bacterium]MBT5800113.1 VOC family protein [Gemmatimonadota bacterium]MBT6618878.1 VOC family protein [Gemmatimonadota bacterium]MBT6903967.1 VOC family protein [Gemmatimonadota bacterium]